MLLSENNKLRIDNSSELYKNITIEFPRNKIDVLEKARNKEIDENAFKKEVYDFCNSYFKTSEEDLNTAANKYTNLIFGYSVLTELINDPEISDIKVVAYNNIRIKRLGKRQGCNVKFESLEDYKSFIDYVITKNHVNASQRNSITRFTDNETCKDAILRFTLSMETTNTYDYPYIAIRKVPKDFLSMEQLVEVGMMDNELKEELIKRFRTGSTIICGSNSSGKTTILNALKEELQEDVAVLIVQQADELTTKSHPDMIFMHSLPGNAESEVTYDLKDVSIAGLTFDVDFIIIGEVKGDEAADLLKASYSGQLSACTVHAPNAGAAIKKIVDYALTSPGNKYSRSELMSMMDCYSTVIYMKNFKVNQVYSIRGFNHQTNEIDYYPVYENNQMISE